MHICTVIVHRVNDFFILFFSLLSLPLTHLTLLFSFPFSSINSLADPRCRPKPHRRSVGFFFFFDLSVAGFFFSGFFLLLICWFLVIFLLWWAISIGLCGFRLVIGVDLVAQWLLIGCWCRSCVGSDCSDGGYVVVLVALGLWVMTVCGLCWVCERDDTVKEMNILFE